MHVVRSGLRSKDGMESSVYREGIKRSEPLQFEREIRTIKVKGRELQLHGICYERDRHKESGSEKELFF